MHNFFKKDDPINFIIAFISFLVWIITKNPDVAMLTLIILVIVVQCAIWVYHYRQRPLKIRKTVVLEQGNYPVGSYTICSTSVLPSPKLQKMIDRQKSKLPQNFKKMFPSLVGFGWNNIWHGDMVAYAMEVTPQSELEQIIYDEFHKCLSEQTGQAKFIQRLEPLLHDIGYNICSKYKVRQKRYIPKGKFISSRRLKIIYNTNCNIYQCLSDWIDFCVDPDFRKSALRLSSSDEYFKNAIFPLVHPFWCFYAPPNQWNNFDRLYFHSELPENYHDFIIPPVEYVEWINKKTGEIINIPKGTHPGFQQNFFLIYDRLFNKNMLIKNIRLK